MKFGVCSAVAMSAALCLSAFGPAARSQGLGTWQDYQPAGWKYYLQWPNNGGIYGPIGIKNLGGGREDVYHSDAGGDPCSGGTSIEMIDVRYCSMTNMTTGVVTGDQFRIFLGNKDLAGNQWFLSMATHGGKPATRFYIDNNSNFVVDAGDTGYFVDCPGPGHPYAPHEIKATQNIIQTWFHQNTARFFWQAVTSPPQTKFNPNWGTSGGASAQAIVHSDSFWCADPTAPASSSCPPSGKWEVGAGTTTTMSDGLIWPDPTSIQIGRSVWHAQYIGPVWWQDTWFPYTSNSGLDRREPFSGC